MKPHTEALALSLAKAGLTADQMLALAAASPWGSNQIRAERLDISQETAESLMEDGYAYDTSSQHPGSIRGITLTGAGRVINNALNDRAAN